MACKEIAVFIVLVVTFWSENRAVFLKKNDENKSNLERNKRSIVCNQIQKDYYSDNGHSMLKKRDVQVQFHNHSATVKWKHPSHRVKAYFLKWIFFVGHCEIKVLDNKTTTYDIRLPSTKWTSKYPLILFIYPLPIKFKKEDGLAFWPSYEQNSGIHPTSSEKNVSQVTMLWEKQPHNEHEEYGLKLIIGLVIGVVATLVLVIMFLRRLCYKVKPSIQTGYFISFFPENEKFVNEVKNFAKWLLDNGHDVQMLTDDCKLLKEENQFLRKEMMSFKFREHMLNSSRKIFMILSSTYLKHCAIKEDEMKNVDFSEEEKLLNGEITQIRGEMHDNLYLSDRFIAVLFNLNNEMTVPFWIKGLPIFSWPKEEKSNKLLNHLKGLPEYPPNCSS